MTEKWPRAVRAQYGQVSGPVAAVCGAVLTAIALSIVTGGAANADSRETALVRDIGELPASVTPARAEELAETTCGVLDAGASGDVIIPWLQDKGFDVESASHLLAWSVNTLCPHIRPSRTDHDS